MENTDLDAKNRIIKATLELLNEEKDRNKITIRKIADEADVSIGLINYHFQSKEKLFKESVGISMEQMAKEWVSKNIDHEVCPITLLKNMLKDLSEFAIQYQTFTQISVSYELLSGNMETPQYILPILRKIFKHNKDEVEIRILALQIIVTIQIMYLRSDIFQRYSGIDISNEKQRNKAIDILIDSIIQ